MLVNYNAGGGCLELTVNEMWTAEHQFTWNVKSTHYSDVCAPDKDYVNDISRVFFVNLLKPGVMYNIFTM